MREELKNHKIKYTKQRDELLSLLKESNQPLTINQIFESLKSTLDLSTIYRTLDLFVEKGLVSKLLVSEPDQTVYEFKHHGHKHHLICTECGLFQIIEGCPLHNYEDRVEESTGFIIARHQLELYGICPACQLLMANA
ncbi:transcriptional repressor [Erysipelothrix sp. D19-032]